MAIRLVMPAVLLAVCGALHAQTSVNVSGTVSDSDTHWLLLEVDYGSTQASITITADLATTSASGLYVELRDLDEMAVMGVDSQIDDWVIGAGSVVVALTPPSRVGVRQLALLIATEDFGPASDFNGTVSVSGGTIAHTDTAVRPDNFVGTRTTFGRHIEFIRETTAAGVYWVDIDLDFGPSAHATTFAVAAGAIPGTQIRVLQVTANPPIELQNWTSSTGFAIGAGPVTTAAYSGVVRFRVTMTKSAGDGGAIAYVDIGSDVALVAATEGSGSGPAPSSGGDGGGGSNCSAATAAHSAFAMLVPLLALVRRRRRAVACGV